LESATPTVKSEPDNDASVSPKVDADESNASLVDNDVCDESMRSVGNETSTLDYSMTSLAVDNVSINLSTLDETTSFSGVDEPTQPSPKSSPKSPEIKSEENVIVSPVDEKSKEIAEIVAAQKVDCQDSGFEKVDENSQPEVAPIAKPEVDEKTRLELEKNRSRPFKDCILKKIFLLKYATQLITSAPALIKVLQS
jgi:hypothetical protein